uniref:Uncharacterized protein n=1 Tax=Megaselia scalaris TaxID=36166 RepID=T1GGS7_MEGSC
MLGYRIVLLACFFMIIASSSARPGIIPDLYKGIFGKSDKDYDKGYEQALKDRAYYGQMNVHPNQPYYYPANQVPVYPNQPHYQTVPLVSVHPATGHTVGGTGAPILGIFKSSLAIIMFGSNIY